MNYVCFRNAFGADDRPCISHVTKPDGSATMCGRTEWVTFEDPYDPEIGVDCIACAKAIEKMKREAARVAERTIREHTQISGPSFSCAAENASTTEVRKT